MLKDNDLVVVRNRNRGGTSYPIDGNWINFEYNEVKKVPFSHLKSLTYTNGGRYLLDHCLVIEDKEALKQLGMNVEPEYYYTDEQIRKVLFDGSYDEFADFLDFAPDGAIEIAKNLAVTEELPDNHKRDMLGQRTGLNISNAIMVNKVMNEDNNDAEEAAPKQRRVKIEEPKTEAPARRVAAPADKNKIIIKK